MRKITLILLILVILVGLTFAQQKDFPVVKGPYFGQKAPGMIPEKFAPGIISTEIYEFGCCFSPDGKEFYFTRKDPKLNRNVIMITRMVDEIWTKPKIVSFIREYAAFEPRITPKGDRLYFTYFKPLPGVSGPPLHTWYVVRQNGKWGEPINPGPPFNPMKTMYISITNDGTIYTNDVSRGVGEDQSIGILKPGEKVYKEMQQLGPPVNIGKRERYPFVAPDESYLIFVSDRIKGKDKMLFVSFKGDKNEWSEPELIPIDMPAALPLVSPDGKYLFFTSGEPFKHDIYWVDAKIIKNLKSENLN